MKCIEFEELVENFDCDQATLDYLQSISFTSGGAEVVFVDLDTIDESYQGRASLIEQWEHFISEVDTETSEIPSSTKVAQLQRTGDGSQLQQQCIDSLETKVTALSALVEKSLLSTAEVLKSEEDCSAKATPADMNDDQAIKNHKDIGVGIEELRAMIDRQNTLYDDFKTLGEELRAAEAGLIDKSQRIERYFANPHRDWLLYGITFSVVLLFCWELFSR